MKVESKNMLKKAEKLVQIGVNCVKRKEITKLELLIQRICCCWDGLKEKTDLGKTENLR